MFYVYVLHSKRDLGLYIGYSTDLRAALDRTQRRRVTSNELSRSMESHYYEAYVEEADAIGRERYLKSGGGRKLLRSQLRNYFTKHRLRTV